MSPESQVEEAIYLAALSLPDPPVRNQFLNRACAGDDRLRAAVESMLQAMSGAEDFFARGRAAVHRPEMEVPLVAASRAVPGQMVPADEPIGSRVGRYQLLQKLGEGGCGAVFLAEQAEPVRRQVALKVIKLGMDTRNVIARFEAERQALAMMDHPNIARVLDAGATETGRPFFVMELVRGTRITKYCDENRLDTVQRLELCLQVCRAIQHAHQKGIIHRDIKPSNILVTEHDGVPVPKVIDFGIAKATAGRLTDSTLCTAVEPFLGTPAYMSPEQAELTGLDVDTRSDIYSLGVLLYELLTGRTPFDRHLLLRSGLDEMRRTLREKEPPLPSIMITSLDPTELTSTARQRRVEPPKLISEIQGDLDWIVMKALEKDRNRRYETANGLAMDIQRYLNCEPVLARPPGQLYRLQKMVRRNRLIFVAGGAVALTLLLGLGLSTWLFFGERAARFRETAAREREAHLRMEAEDRARIAQVVIYVSQKKFADADRLLQQVGSSSSLATLDGVSAYRSVGQWLAIHGRWQAAAERYLALLKIDHVDGPNLATLDYQACGILLAKAGDPQQYANFRQMALTNIATVPNGGILKICLLFPVDARQTDQLKPIADREELPLRLAMANPICDWKTMPAALWRYRRGDFRQAAEWCQLGLSQKIKYPACTAALHVIRAMANYQEGNTNEAGSELMQGRQLIAAKLQGGLDSGKAGEGYWHDWLFADFLLQEANALVDGLDGTVQD